MKSQEHGSSGKRSTAVDRLCNLMSSMDSQEV